MIYIFIYFIYINMPRNTKKVNVKMSMELVQHLQDYLNQIDLEGMKL